QMLTAKAEADAQTVRARGEADAIHMVFKALHTSQVDPDVLAYHYLQKLPEIAQGSANKVWIVPAEMGQALQGVGSAFEHIRDEVVGAPREIAAAGRGLARARGGTGEDLSPARCFRDRLSWSVGVFEGRGPMCVRSGDGWEFGRPWPSSSQGWPRGESTRSRARGRFSLFRCFLRSAIPPSRRRFPTASGWPPAASVVRGPTDVNWRDSVGVRCGWGACPSWAR